MTTKREKSEPSSKENPLKNIQLVGTSHIAEESVNKVTRIIKKHDEAIVAVELDTMRLQALLSKQQATSFSLRDITKVGVTGFVFAIIGSYVTRKLAKVVNQEPGADMLAAVKAAQEKKHQIALIDQPIQKTLKRFSEEVTWKEKGKALIDILQAIFFQKSQLKKFGINHLDLTKVPAKTIIKKLIDHLKIRYPNVYKVLIAERNKYMVKKLVTIALNHPDKLIIAVVGAGHEEGMEKLLKSVQIRYK